MKLVLTPADEPIQEHAARAQVATEWAKAQNELAEMISSLPPVANALIDGTDMPFAPEDLRRLTEAARTLSFHVSMLSVALDNAADIAHRAKRPEADK